MACYFNAGNTQLVSFDQLNNRGAIDKKMVDQPMMKNHLFTGLDKLNFMLLIFWTCNFISAPN